METLHSIVIAIVGNVAAYYIVKWLGRVEKPNN